MAPKVGEELSHTRQTFARFAFWKPRRPKPPTRKTSLGNSIGKAENRPPNLIGRKNSNHIEESKQEGKDAISAPETPKFPEIIIEVGERTATVSTQPPLNVEQEDVEAPMINFAPTSPVRTDTGATQDGKSAKVNAAIGKLNQAIIRLYKTSAVLRGGLKPENWSNAADLDFLTARNLDEEVQRVATVTQQLITEQKRIKGEQSSQQGLMVATERFLGATGRLISPALKSFLKVVLQGSAVCLFLAWVANK